MITKTNLLYLLFLAVFLLPLEQSIAQEASSSRLLCVVDVQKQHADSKAKAQQKKAVKRLQKKKSKFRKWWTRNKNKTLLALLGGSVFGFLFRKRRKRKHVEAVNGSGDGTGGIILTVLLLGGLIWFFVATGLPLKTILLILGIAIVSLAIAVGLIVLAFKNM